MPQLEKSLGARLCHAWPQWPSTRGKVHFLILFLDGISKYFWQHIKFVRPQLQNPDSAQQNLLEELQKIFEINLQFQLKNEGLTLQFFLKFRQILHTILIKKVGYPAKYGNTPFTRN